MTGLPTPPPTTPGITCPVCTRTSYHPEDIREGYCVACHAFTAFTAAPDSCSMRAKAEVHAGGIVTVHLAGYFGQDPGLVGQALGDLVAEVLNAYVVTAGRAASVEYELTDTGERDIGEPDLDAALQAAQAQGRRR